MSRAFMREDADSEDVIVTHRPPLPEGTPNLVTEAGLAALEAERAARLQELADLAALEQTPEVTRRRARRDEELLLLLERLATATVAVPPRDRLVVGVGATVQVRHLNGPQLGQPSEFRVVGVDESDPLLGLVAFTAPAAQALLGRRQGDVTAYEAGGRRLEVRLERVTYGE